MPVFLPREHPRLSGSAGVCEKQRAATASGGGPKPSPPSRKAPPNPLTSGSCPKRYGLLGKTPAFVQAQVPDLPAPFHQASGDVVKRGAKKGAKRAPAVP